MRAINGAVVFSKPCSLKKAARILISFSDTATSHLPSSDCATYLCAAAEATADHHRFRDQLHANRQQGATDLDARGYEGPVEGERKQQDGESNGGMEVPAGGPRGSAKEAELAVAASEKKRKKKEDPHEDMTVAGVASHGPASPEIANGKRKKEKHASKEIARDVKLEPGLVATEELGSEKKKSNRKMEKGHVKLEDDAGDVKEVKGQIVNNVVAVQGIASGEKRRKKKKHAEEEGEAKDVKEEGKMDIDGDLNNEKKRKKKRGRGGDDDNDQEQTEHTKKKQKMQP